MLHSWVMVAVGAWVLLSPWLLGVSGVAVIMWSNLLAGLTLIIMNLWVIFDGAGHASSKDGEAPLTNKNGKVGPGSGTNDK